MSVLNVKPEKKISKIRSIGINNTDKTCAWIVNKKTDDTSLLYVCVCVWSFFKKSYHISSYLH